LLNESLLEFRNTLDDTDDDVNVVGLPMA